MASEGTQGISVETQILRLLTFATRYIDLVYYREHISLYNTIVKWIILCSSLLTVSTLIHGKFQSGLNTKATANCVFRIAAQCIVPLIAAIYINYAPNFIDITWTFSQYLGIVSDCQQFHMNITSGTADRKTIVYLALITGYRLFYMPHWVFRYFDMGVLDPISWISGVFTFELHLICFLYLARSMNKKQLRDQEQEAAIEKGYGSAEKEKN